MSDESARKSHTMTWVVSVLVVLLLYAASWPPIELKMASYKIVVGPFDTLRERQVPKWIDLLYKPMHDLQHCNAERNPVAQYFAWWRELIPELEPM